MSSNNKRLVSTSSTDGTRGFTLKASSDNAGIVGKSDNHRTLVGGDQHHLLVQQQQQQRRRRQQQQQQQ